MVDWLVATRPLLLYNIMNRIYRQTDVLFMVQVSAGVSVIPNS